MRPTDAAPVRLQTVTHDASVCRPVLPISDVLGRVILQGAGVLDKFFGNDRFWSFAVKPECLTWGDFKSPGLAKIEQPFLPLHTSRDAPHLWLSLLGYCRR